jgi:uncharacterized protein YuzE
MINIDKRINLIVKELNDLNELIGLHEEHIKQSVDDSILKNVTKSLKYRKLELVNKLKQIQDIKSNKPLKGKGYYEYDYEHDIFSIKTKEDYNYETALDLGKGLILDFNNNNISVALEILNASKLFNIKKSEIKNIKYIKMNVSINKKMINVNLKIGVNIRNKTQPKSFDESVSFDKSVSNNINAPAINTELLVV